MDESAIAFLHEHAEVATGTLPPTYRDGDNVRAPFNLRESGIGGPAFLVAAGQRQRLLAAGITLPSILSAPNSLILAQIARTGVEAIAWYRSFHVDHENWGIYVWDEALETFAEDALSAVSGLTGESRIELVLEFVLAHEILHYQIDCGSALMELIDPHGLAFYRPYLRQHPGLDSPLVRQEEALANARAWRHITWLLKEGQRAPSARPEDVLKALEEAMARQPEGYRDWAQYRSPARYASGLRKLGAAIHNVSVPVQGLPVSFFGRFFTERPPSGMTGAVPVRMLSRRGGSGRQYQLSYARPLVIAESTAFQRWLRKAPEEVRRAWHERTRPQLESGNWVGVDFKPRKGYPDMFQCRVGRGHRALLKELTSSNYEVVSIDNRGHL